MEKHSQSEYDNAQYRTSLRYFHILQISLCHWAKIHTDTPQTPYTHTHARTSTVNTSRTFFVNAIKA